MVTQHLIHCTEALSTGLLRGWRRLVVFLFPTLKHAHSPAGRLLRKPDDKLRQRCCWGGIPLAYRSFCSADHAETLTKNGSYTKGVPDTRFPFPVPLPYPVVWRPYCPGKKYLGVNTMVGSEHGCACSLGSMHTSQTTARPTPSCASTHPPIPAASAKAVPTLAMFPLFSNPFLLSAWWERHGG